MSKILTITSNLGKKTFPVKDAREGLWTFMGYMECNEDLITVPITFSILEAQA